MNVTFLMMKFFHFSKAPLWEDTSFYFIEKFLSPFSCVLFLVCTFDKSWLQKSPIWLQWDEEDLKWQKLFLVDTCTLLLATTMSRQYLKHIRGVSDKKPSATCSEMRLDNQPWSRLVLLRSHGWFFCPVSQQFWPTFCQGEGDSRPQRFNRMWSVH